MEKKQMKRKGTHKSINKTITPTFIRAIILSFPIVFLIVHKAMIGNLTLEDFFSIDTFTAIIIAFLCQTIADFVVKIIESKNEDSLKLTENNEGLLKKYNRANLLQFGNETFPTVCLLRRNCEDAPFHFVFDDTSYNKKYQLPAQIASNSDHLMKAHAHSKIYNQLNIRLDNIKQINNDIILSYSQTYYYDSLITNRSMDYCWENGKSIREVYEPGPFLSDLASSKLSNHLGFNGFLETSDEKIIFVKRGKDLSIGKSTWSGSIGASLKAMYALNEDQKLYAKGLSNAIKAEIQDELYIEIGEDVDLSKSIFAFYRDLVEGGKPQFLFYYKLDNYTFETFEKNFKQRYEKNNNVVDGTEFIGLSIEECRKCELASNGIVYNGNFYKMTASASSSMAMLFQYLGSN